MAHRDIVVLGASAGGVEALRTILRGLPGDLPAAVFLVTHTSADSPSVLAQVLDRHAKIPVKEATDGEPIRHGRVYVARPDRHLLLEERRVRVVRGPKQNRHRPALDPLFRSAAVAFGPRVIGVVLTGNLDDGTAGLRAIKNRGGLAIVQDPREALFAGMPQSALNHVDVDHVLPVAAIAGAVQAAVEEAVEMVTPAPDPDLEVEVRSDAGEGRMEDMEAIGTPSVFSCPECSGTLWEVGEADLPRFRCRVGHAYTAENLVAQQDEAAEDTLWAALRSLEENVTLARRMTERFRGAAGMASLAARYARKADTLDKHARDLRRLLTEKAPAEKVPQEEPQAT
jgi:two-component system, chemotaxis family, protein-glutamate methylesterase/glutaminase